MTTELFALLATCVLLQILSSGPVFAGMRRQWGLLQALGNRETVPELTGWAGRAKRAHDNLAINLGLFSAVILIAAHLDVSNEVTSVSSLVFLGARIVHAVSYIAGIKYIRTLAYLTGVGATVVIGVELL